MPTKRRSEKMTTWVDKNKVFIYIICTAIFMVGLAWGTTQMQVRALEEKAAEECVKLKAEIVRSQRVDNARGPQMAGIQKDIAYLKETSQEVKGAVKDLNTKIDWLIQNSPRKTD